jgi:methylmalonyl-CoA epimerase
MIGKVAHIGVAVKEIEPIRHLYRETLGLPVSEEEQNDELSWVFVPIGETAFEFIHPKTEDNPIARFIKKQGEGVHHVALEVKDIEDAIRELKTKGIPLVDEKPRKGAHNSRIAFIHPKATQGVLIELVEPFKGEEGTL